MRNVNVNELFSVVGGCDDEACEAVVVAVVEEEAAAECSVETVEAVEFVAAE